MKKKIWLVVLIVFLLMIFVPNVNAASVSWLSSEKVSCGTVGNIPAKVPEFISLFILVMQIIVPILLIIFGSIDLAKGVMAQKEDEIKKGQQAFIKRLITGIIVFLIVAIVKVLVSVVAGGTENRKSIVDCINCFINGECTSATSTPTPGGGGTMNTETR